MAEIHLVAVDGEDFLLRVALLDLDGENRLAYFSLERFLVGEAELLLEVAGQLLGEGTGALRAPPLHDVGQRRDRDAPDVHAEMAIELGVLGRDDGLAQHGVDVVVADDDTPLRGELADDLAVGRQHTRDRARRVVVERRHLRQVARIGEENAAQDPEHGRNDEQRRDSGAANDLDDVGGHLN